METDRLILDSIRESDKEDYFINISHDKMVLETFIYRYAETMEEFDFSSCPGRQDLFAIRLKETGRLIGIILYFDEKEDTYPCFLLTKMSHRCHPNRCCETLVVGTMEP